MRLMIFFTVVFLGLFAACRTDSAQDPREGYLPGAGGLKLFYRVIGSGKPLIVVHGGPGGSMSLLRDLEPLADHHRLIF